MTLDPDNDTRQLVSEALRLAPRARAAIVGALILSLEAERDPHEASPWLADVRSRLEDLREGKVASISWSEAYRRIHQAAARRDSWE